MLENQDLLLIYSILNGQLKKLFHPSKPQYDTTKKQSTESEIKSNEIPEEAFELDYQAREAVRRLSILVHDEAPLNNTQLGRAVRHGIYRKHILHLWGRYFNSYYSNKGCILEYNKHVQDIMEDMAGAVPGKPWSQTLEPNRMGREKFHAYMQLFRHGKIRIRELLMQRPIKLIIVPNVPVHQFDTPKGVWEYKGLTASIKGPKPISYNGKDLGFKPRSLEYKILKALIKRPEEKISFYDLHTKICGHAQNTKRPIRTNQINSRLTAIKKKLQEYSACPMIISTGGVVVLK